MNFVVGDKYHSRSICSRRRSSHIIDQKSRWVGAVTLCAPRQYLHILSGAASRPDVSVGHLSLVPAIRCLPVVGRTLDYVVQFAGDVDRPRLRTANAGELVYCQLVIYHVGDSSNVYTRVLLMNICTIPSQVICCYMRSGRILLLPLLTARQSHCEEPGACVHASGCCPRLC